MCPFATAAERQALVLVVDDDAGTVDILATCLKRHGWQSARATDGRRALDLFHALKPDLVLLDVRVPGPDGRQMMSVIRHGGPTPVIMLAEPDHDIDAISGLRMGADDYMIKPLDPVEVVARTQAVLRRASTCGAGMCRKVLRVEEFEIDVECHEVTVRAGQQCHVLSLTLTEFRLLAHLAQTPRRVFSRAELLAACLPEGDAQERTVDSHVSQLRRKIERTGVLGVPCGVRGVGYRFGATRRERVPG